MTAYAVQRRDQAGGLCPACRTALADSPLAQRMNKSASAVAQAKLAARLSGGAVQRESLDHDEETMAVQQKAAAQRMIGDEEDQA